MGFKEVESLDGTGGYWYDTNYQYVLEEFDIDILQEDSNIEYESGINDYGDQIVRAFIHSTPSDFSTDVIACGYAVFNLNEEVDFEAAQQITFGALEQMFDDIHNQ